MHHWFPVAAAAAGVKTAAEVAAAAVDVKTAAKVAAAATHHWFPVASPFCKRHHELYGADMPCE